MAREFLINAGCDTQIELTYNATYKNPEHSGFSRQHDGTVVNKNNEIVWEIKYNKNHRSLFTKVMMGIGIIVSVAITVASIAIINSPDIILSMFA